MTSTPSLQQLRRATEIAEQIEQLEQELRNVLGQDARVIQPTEASAETKAPEKRLQARKKRTMSPEAREKIASAQRARWAKDKKSKGK